MTMTSSRSASAHVRAIALLFAAALAPSTSEAGTYVGIAAATFDGPAGYDNASKGAEFTAGFELRPWLAIEAGVLQQDGESPLDEVPADLTEYEWRALYVGPGFSRALGERWHVQAGVALAHVALEREIVAARFQPGRPIEYVDGGSFDSSSWGALARIGLAVDLTPRQRLSLDYRRLHAGLEHTCETYFDEYSNGVRCGLLRHRSTDGVSLAWNWRFD